MYIRGHFSLLSSINDVVSVISPVLMIYCPDLAMGWGRRGGGDLVLIIENGIVIEERGRSHFSYTENGN